MKPKNIDKPMLEISHAALAPTISGSLFRRKCPVCREGVLLVRRDENLQICAEDYCIGCGQRFLYTDIEQLRKQDYKKPNQ